MYPYYHPIIPHKPSLTHHESPFSHGFLMGILWIPPENWKKQLGLEVSTETFGFGKGGDSEVKIIAKRGKNDDFIVVYMVWYG